jgi:hypothetical protein
LYFAAQLYGSTAGDTEAAFGVLIHPRAAVVIAVTNSLRS